MCTFFQHFANGVIEFIKLRVSAHHTGHCQPFGCQFTIRQFAFTAKAVTHAAGNHHFFTKADFWRNSNFVITYTSRHQQA
ncbi:Uncharacterised protein [Shigella flexneri]|nr:Uncharacterised protein [Shigella flexneri]